MLKPHKRTVYLFVFTYLLFVGCYIFGSKYAEIINLFHKFSPVFKNKTALIIYLSKSFLLGFILQNQLLRLEKTSSKSIN